VDKPPLNEVEARCIKLLAKLYADGQQVWSRQTALSTIGLTEANYSQVLGLLESIGAIRDVQHNMTEAGRFFSFRTDARAVQIARELEAQEEKENERKDILEQLKVTMKRHPFGGRVTAILALVLLLATAVNQISGALRTLGQLFR
jgi:hypothetical protein